MLTQPDCELLHRYVYSRDAAAFSALVRRHIGFVYAAARRQTRDSHLADDVTQAVFLVLARKAKTIRSDLAMSTWLFAVTRRASQNALKLQSRRRFHEHSAAAQRTEQLREQRTDVPGVRALLDDAIACLPKGDQGGVLLHFFDDLSYAQVGSAMGTSAEAARKRIERAVDKMKRFLARRGIADSGAALSASIGMEAAVRPPAYLVASTANVAVLASVQSTSPGLTLSLAQGITRMFAMAKLKLTIAGVAAALAVGVPLLSNVIAGPLLSVANVVAATTTTATADEPLKIELDKKTSIEVLGAAKFPDDEDSWVAPTGTPLNDVPNPFAHVKPTTPLALDSQVLIRVRHPASTVTNMTILGASVDSSSDEDSPADDGVVTMVRIAFQLEAPADRFGVRFSIADEPWATIMTHDTPGEPAQFESDKYGEFHVLPIRDQEGNSVVDVQYAAIPGMLRLLVVDDHGAEIAHSNADFNYDGTNVVATFTFPTTPAKVAKLRLEARPYSRTIDVTKLALSRGVATEPAVKIIELKK